MFRRVVIQNASGNLLKSCENYNDLHCLTELLTDSVQNRQGAYSFQGEGLKIPGNTVPTVIDDGVVCQNSTIDVSPFAANITCWCCYV